MRYNEKDASGAIVNLIEIEPDMADWYEKETGHTLEIVLEEEDIPQHEYTALELTQQEITDNDLSLIEQGQALTELELTSIEQGQFQTDLELTILTGGT